MSIIFFNCPVDTPKVQFVNTDKTVAQLVKAGVIPEGAATLKTTFPNTPDGLAKLAHVDKLTFDNMERPTEVVWDMDLVDLFWKEVYRECRKELMATLDVLQQRALVKGLTGVVSDIEDDKQKLRDLTDSVDYSQYDNFEATDNHYPQEMFIDYESKYADRLS